MKILILFTFFISLLTTFIIIYDIAVGITNVIITNKAKSFKGGYLLLEILITCISWTIFYYLISYT